MRLAGGKQGAELGQEAGGRAQRSSRGMCGLLHKARLPLLPQEQRFLPSQLLPGGALTVLEAGSRHLGPPVHRESP